MNTLNHVAFFTVIVTTSFAPISFSQAQVINRTAFAQVEQNVGGVITQTTNNSISASVAGSILGHERSLAPSGSYGRSSSVVDVSALRFSMKARGQANAFAELNPISGITAGALSDALFNDLLFITSASLPDGNSTCIARVRLIVSAQQTLSSTNSGLAALSSSIVNLVNFRDGFVFWSLPITNSISEEFFVDVPAYIARTTNSAQLNQLSLLVSIGANARGLPPSDSNFAEGILTVTWGGIVAVTLDDSTPMADYQVKNQTGTDYRYQRTRTDLAASLARPNASSIAIHWPGTSNIFYQVEHVSSLASDHWLPLGETTEGLGSNAVMDPISTTGTRFYRVVDAPLP